MTRKAIVAMAMALAFSLPALAQKITVTGTVYEPEGEPALGASVVIAGQNTGVVTDLDGNYSILVDANGSLVFSYIGCDTQTIPVQGRTSIDVHLTTNAVALNEVVAIGYGAVRKQDATGSVAVIKPDEIEAGLATSTQDLLVGASPGVVVTTDGGNPTGGATIRIRGGSSLNASNDPLIVIDGVPQTNQGQGSSLNAMTMLNPADIESMTILKDASATAIYGSRASNGVIIIQTKKGRKGKPQVNFSANFSVNTARKMLKVMDGDKYAETVRMYCGEGTIEQLGWTNPTNGEYQLYNTNWQKEVLRTTFSQDYNLSVGGAAGVVPYRVNVGYTNNQGILKTSAMDRVTAGLSLTPKFFDDKLSITANVNGTYARQDNADTGAVSAALSYDPTKPVYSNIPMQGNTGMYLYNGFYNVGTTFSDNSTQNPLGMLMGTNSYNDTWSSTGNLQIDYALHFLPELHLNLNLGYQVSKNDATSFTEANSVNAWLNNGLVSNGAAGAETMYKWHEVQQNTLLDFYLNYKKDFEAIKSGLDVMVGYSWQRFNYFGNSQTYVNSLGFVGRDGNPGFTYDSASNTYYMDRSTHDAIGEVAGYASPSTWAYPLQLLSFFGRLNYILNDTYLLTFTLRDDASSRFSKSTRWGLFPSVALGWKINNCFGLKDADWLSEFKLRLGWGETGQQAIGDLFLYMPVYTISSNNNYQYPGYYFPGQAGYGNWVSPLYPNAYDTGIKWETTTTWNAGIDFGVLNNRLNISFDWYLRNTRDLLASAPAIGSNTSNYLTRNIGKLQNYGVELNITARPVVTENFRWTTGFNLAWNHNEITSLNNGSLVDAGDVPGSIGTHLQWYEEGYPVRTFRVYQQVYDHDGNPIQNQFVDQNGDGVIDEKDLIHYHSPDPKVTVNWNNTFNFHNWDLGFSLRANMGNYVYNNPLRERTNTSSLDMYGLHNLLDNTFLFHNAPSGNEILSDYYVQNAAFLRCDNITLGYTWSNLLHDNLRLRLFGAVQNPFVITKYKGIDPEVFGGLDSSVYPRPVTFTLGLVATF